MSQTSTNSGRRQVVDKYRSSRGKMSIDVKATLCGFVVVYEVCSLMKRHDVAMISL